MSSSAASSESVGCLLSSRSDRFTGLQLVAPASTMAIVGTSSGPIHFRHLIMIKLSAKTHLLWHAQVVSLLRSNLLHGFVKGTHLYPSDTTTVTKDDAQESVPNPSNVAWLQQDQAILQALHSSSNIEVTAMIMFVATSAEAWNIIECSFVACTTTRSSQIRAQ
jgi:hypothetical protein